MLPGYNHNVQYKGKIYHIQTEDSGVQNPHIITLLYYGGNILARKKTSYADILKSDKLNTVVKEMMQEQHKGMLKELKNETFDQRIFGDAPPSQPTAIQPVPQQPTSTAPMAPQPQIPAEQVPPPKPVPADVKLIELSADIELKDEDIFGADLISDKSLDEVILNYLSDNIEDD